GNDLSTTAALSQAVQNMDTNAAQIAVATTFTANQVFNALWSDAAQVSVASAATFALPTTGNNVNVTGTTGITDFSGPATNGVVYKLQFTNATPGSVTSGNHAKLNGSFSPAQNNILYLYWDGTNAWEIGRYTGAAGTTSLTTIGPTFAAADTTMTNANQFYTAVTLGSALPSGGKVLLSGSVTVAVTANDDFVWQMYDSTNSVVITSQILRIPNGQRTSVSIPGVVY